MLDPASCDSVRKPSHALALWIAPGGAAAAAFFWADRLPQLLLLGAAACAVMGVACLANAARCRRLHCFLTGPYFLLLALAAGIAFGFDRAHAHHAGDWLLLGLAFAPLLIWLPERLSGITYCRTGRRRARLA